MKHNSEIYLRALLNGRTLDVGLSYPIFLHTDGIGKHHLLFDYSNKCTPICDMTLADFINQCEKKPVDEAFITAAETALDKINSKDRG